MSGSDQDVNTGAPRGRGRRGAVRIGNSRDRSPPPREIVEWGQRFVGGGRRQERDQDIGLGLERVVPRLNKASPEEIAETIEGWELDKLAKLFAGKDLQNPTAQKLVQALQRDRIRLVALAEEITRREVVGVTDVGTALRGNTPVTAFLAAAGRNGPGRDYLETCGSGVMEVLGTQTDKPETASVRDLRDITDDEERLRQRANNNRTIAICKRMVDRLIADIRAMPIPTEISRVCAVMSEEGRQRGFDERQARILVGGQVFLRLINPFFTDLIKTLQNQPVDQRLILFVTKIMQNVSNDVPFSKEPEWQPYNALFFPGVRDAVAEFLDRVVESGQAARSLAALAPDLDLDEVPEVVAAAKRNDRLLAALFKDPTEDDPLGTDPRDPMMPIGRAIATAAAQRSRDYELDGLLNMPEQHQSLVHSERLDVLDLIPLI